MPGRTTIANPAVPDEPQETALQEAPGSQACITHLRLLEALVYLRDRLQRWGDSSGIQRGEAWRAAVKLAAVRFCHWCSCVAKSDADVELSRCIPPLDILMVWHAFMLNPKKYSAYCKRLPNATRFLEGIDWKDLDRAFAESAGLFILPGADANVAHSMKLHSDLCGFLETPQGKTMVKYLASESTAAPGNDEGGELSKVLAEGITELAASGFAVPINGITFALTDAVHRQANFADAMFQLGWLHSPVLESTLERARQRYVNFFTLIAEAGPRISSVPTRDVDLVWHTHQLSPACYSIFSACRAGGKFVDHNDSVKVADLRDQFLLTESTYTRRFGETYNICLSWLCEARRLGNSAELPDQVLASMQLAIKGVKGRRSRADLLPGLALAACECGQLKGSHNLAVASSGCEANDSCANAVCDTNSR